MTEDPKQRLSLAIARARRLEPDKSLLELLESMTASTSKKKTVHLTDEELLGLADAWIVRKKAILRRTSGKAEK